jgi:Fic family protein
MLMKMDSFLELPEIAVADLADKIFVLEELVKQISLLEPAKPSERIQSAFEYMQGLVNGEGTFSFASIARLHELIGKDGKLRERPDSFFSEENIAIRDYHPAPAEDLKEILAMYFTKYHPNQVFSDPFVKITSAYLTFELIHPFHDGNGG